MQVKRSSMVFSLALLLALVSLAAQKRRPVGRLNKIKQALMEAEKWK